MTHDRSARAPEGPRFLEVRRSVWVALALAVVVALLVPTVTFWQAAARSLHAEARVWPAAPSADGPAKVVVALTDPADQAAIRGPWAQVQVVWDMVTMPMGTRPVVVHGQQDSNGTFAIPLQFAMAGPWRFNVSVNTPGRPAWHSAFVVNVLPQGQGGQAASSAASVPLAACIGSLPLVAAEGAREGSLPL